MAEFWIQPARKANVLNQQTESQYEPVHKNRLMLELLIGECSKTSPFSVNLSALALNSLEKNIKIIFLVFDFEGFSIPEFIHYIYFPILILEKEPVFSLLNVQC